MTNYFVFVIIIQSCLLIQSHSKSIIKRLPGYPGDLPFQLETGQHHLCTLFILYSNSSYIGIGEKEDIQFFYYFVESTGNPEEDPLLFYISGGPGASSLLPFMDEIGPVNLNKDNLTLTLNPSAWTQMSSIIFVDMPAGTGFSYAETEEGWINGDTIFALQAIDFLKKFFSNHPKFLQNPLYVTGASYAGIIVPKVALDLYEGNERGDLPVFNIQGYIICSPLTDKFTDFNSRLEYAHRMALISDDIYQSAIDNCHGNYLDINFGNSVCSKSLQSYVECTSHIYVENILGTFCNESDPTLDCERDYNKALDEWANIDAVQEALNVRQGKVAKWKVVNNTLHYSQGKNDTMFYSYDILSSFSYHKKLSSKSCRALIYSGDHDMTFPYVGVEQWITSLNLQVELPWKPFYVDDQVGGYVTKYAINTYSLTYATVKGAGHIVPLDKPKETMTLAKGWFSSQTYSSDS